MRAVALLLLLASVSPADEADDYFEVGLAYLKTGFYKEARAAFAESLVRAPSESVPTAFTALACAGEGRDSRSCAHLLRLAYRRLPKGRTLQIDLNARLRSTRDRELIERRFRSRLKDHRGRAVEGQARIDNLAVLAFLEVHDGTPATSDSLAALLKARPDDAFGVALQKWALQKAARPKKKKVKEKAPAERVPPERDAPEGAPRKPNSGKNDGSGGGSDR